MNVYRQVVSDLLSQHPESGWGLTVGSYGKGKQNPYWNSLLAVNLAVKALVADDSARYAFLSTLVGREIKTSKDLTIAEVKAFLRLYNRRNRS